MGHLRSMHRSCCRHGRTLQFWANALHDDPEQLLNLPPGVIAMEYGHTVFIAFQFFHSLYSKHFFVGRQIIQTRLRRVKLSMRGKGTSFDYHDRKKPLCCTRTDLNFLNN